MPCLVDGSGRMNHAESFEVIVIGGGHAGTEAALAAARMGRTTLLLTQSIETLGQMSCNPAIGGIGKSHLVREIDALGGAMALATDQSGIQFRVLNARKGPAVRATRAQADRQLYKAAIRWRLEHQPGLRIFQQMVDDLIIEGERVTGVVTQAGLRFHARSVVLTAGTFLAGVLHIGLAHHRGGRAGDPAALTLAQRLRELPLRVGRLKTGTPPRIDARSIDFSGLAVQPGDTPEPVMSFLGDVAMHPRQLPCHITHTCAATHDIIRANLDRSPLYTGVIAGVGPRYCPSIEDKIHRFADKDSHQVFLEPEGLNSQEIYPNGISTSLPFDVQLAVVRSLPGLQQAHITRPGYAIEYDYFDPRDLQMSLQTRQLQGLFFAGQINGTTGYEEAAAQGLLAGINAARAARDEEPWIPLRDQAYIGVMVDDLVTHGTQEPYRMFTSRAEYRLQLREDNADERLTEQGYALGVIDATRYQRFIDKQEAIERATQRLRASIVHPHSLAAQSLAAATGESLQREYSMYDLLRRPAIGIADLLALEAQDISAEVAEQIQIRCKYAGYIDRQAEEVARLHAQEGLALAADFDYDAVRGLSHEVCSKLKNARPQTLAQAARIPGVTPAALSLLMIHLRRPTAGAA